MKQVFRLTSKEWSSAIFLATLNKLGLPASTPGHVSIEKNPLDPEFKVEVVIEVPEES